MCSMFVPPSPQCAAQSSAGSDEGSDGETRPPLDRATAMEDCSRLVREAEESLPIAHVVSEALMVLNITALNANIATLEEGAGRMVSTKHLSADTAAVVNAEVASAVTEAEGLVDGLLRVIQAGFYLRALVEMFFFAT